MAKIPSPPNHPFFLWNSEFQSCAEEAIFSDFSCADKVVKESDFCAQADGNMHNFFLNSEYNEKFMEFRQLGSTYEI